MLKTPWSQKVASSRACSQKNFIRQNNIASIFPWIDNYHCLVLLGISRPCLWCIPGISHQTPVTRYRMHHHSGGGLLMLRIDSDCNLSSIKQSNLGFCPILRSLFRKSVSKPTRHFSRILYAITTMFSTIFSLLSKFLVTTWEGQPGIEPPLW